MRILSLLPVLLLAATPALANPFAKGDIKNGKALLDKSCISCHASMTGGDGSAIYSRFERKMKTAQQLQDRIRFCNTNAGANWLPDEENDVGAYLNNAYYHFK